MKNKQITIVYGKLKIPSNGKNYATALLGENTKGNDFILPTTLMFFYNIENAKKNAEERRSFFASVPIQETVEFIVKEKEIIIHEEN